MTGKTGQAPNRILTAARDLQRRKARERRGQFVAEGVRVVEELVRSGLTLDGALVTSALSGSERGRALLGSLQGRTDVVEVSDADFASAADTENPQGVLAIGACPTVDLRAAIAAGHGSVLVLDAIQDPGNVGTLLRTAAALGASAVVALPGTADVWNAKVVRSGAGAHFRLPVVQAELADLSTVLAELGMPLWASDASGTDIGVMGKGAPKRIALAVGNEGAGVSDAVRASAAGVVSLPMTPGAESLNVTVAAGIILYALRS
ncbi:MAG: RNA methyltransferase [Gemmatimonadetes bacterium]|nr:RNA methyltransferase [Gemmatimonadota bacterium]